MFSLESLFVEEIKKENHGVLNYMLITLTTLWANSATDDKWMIFILLFPENRFCKSICILYFFYNIWT